MWDCVVRQGDLRVTDDGGRDGDDAGRMLGHHDGRLDGRSWGVRGRRTPDQARVTSPLAACAAQSRK